MFCRINQMESPTSQTSKERSFLLNIRFPHMLMRVVCIAALGLLFTLSAVGGYPIYAYFLPLVTFLYHLS